MARRLFRGNAFSENGWPYVDEGSCTWTVVPGSNSVHLEIQNGAPLAIMRALAADFNAYVEPLRDPDSACWTQDNSVSTSNHPGGTAMDLNWNSHAFQVRGTFNPGQQATIRELVDFYGGTIFWAGDWNSPVDEMHWQMGYDTYDQGSERPKQFVLDFIARNIRADGFSTFRRGQAPQMPDAALVLSQATGLDLNSAIRILPTMREGLRQAQCTNFERIAMFIAQTGHESAGFSTTIEFASGAEYEGRKELGNIFPGDGVRYKGRCWIQITGRHNYGEFSRWANANGLVPTSTYFVDNPEQLAELQWAAIGAAWYWTVARPDINTLCDQRDIELVSRRINGTNPNTGRANGIDQRIARYNRAMGLGPKLLGIIADPTEPLDEWEALMADNTLYSSLSPYRDNDDARFALRDMVRIMDGRSHAEDIETAAIRGHAPSIAMVAQLASGQGPEGQNPWFVDRAKNVLRIIQANLAAQTGVPH